MTRRRAIAGVDVDRQRRGIPRPTPRNGPRRWRSRSPAKEGIDALTDRHWQVDQLHAGRVRRQGDGPDRPRPGQDLRRPRQGALPALPEGPGQDWPPRSPASRSRAAASDRIRPATSAATRQGAQHGRTDRESLDHHLQGIARGHLPGADHGQRRTGRGDRGESVLHLLRPRRHPQAGTTTSRSRPSATPDCTWPAWPGVLPGMSPR